MSSAAQWIVILVPIAFVPYVYWSLSKGLKVHVFLRLLSYIGALAIGGVASSILLIFEVIPQNFFVLNVLLFGVIHFFGLKRIYNRMAINENRKENSEIS